MGKIKKKDATPEMLRKFFDCCPETGIIRNKIDRGIAKSGDIPGFKRKDGYIEIYFNAGTYLAHRIAWAIFHGEWPSQRIDHISGIRDENCISNLRDISHKANLQNRKRAQTNNLSTGMLGVHFDKSLYRYVARIKIGNKHVHLGIFECRFAAYKAYRDAKRKYHEGCTI